MDINAALVELLRETFEGMVGNGTWYSDSEPNSGIFGTLDRVSAADASRLVCGKSTLAAHAIHCIYYMDVVNDRIEKVDWESSWTEQSVSEARWQEIKAEMRRAYGEVRERLASKADWDEKDELIGGIAAVTHAAFHLGAMRQMIR